MKPALRILKWITIGVFLMLLVLFTISQLLQADMVNIVVGAINKNISTKIEVGSGSFSLISKFPKATVKLNNVLVHSSPDYDHSQFKINDADTLLSAKTVLLEFKLSDLVRGIYNIESVSIQNGSVNLLSDSLGKVNYDIKFNTAPSSGKGFALNLDKIFLSGLEASYINTATKINIEGIVKNGRFKSRITGNSLDLSASSAMQLSRLEVFPIFLKTTTSASIDVNIHKSDSGFYFRKGALKIDNFNLSVSGLIRPDNNLDLKISGRNIDVPRIRKYLPANYQNWFTEFDPEGILRIDCRIKGLASRKSNPEIAIYFALDKGEIDYKKSNLKLSQLSFYGNFRNGRLRSPVTSSLEISKAVGKLGASQYTGSLLVENFSDPKIDMTLSGEIIPFELAHLFNLKDIPWSEGSAKLNLKLSGHLPLKDKYSPADIMKLNPDADIEFKSMGIGLDKNKVIIKDINGNINVSRHLLAKDLSFSYNGQHIKINGDFTNLPAWLAGESVRIRAVGDISADNIKLSTFLPDSSSVSANKKAFILPEGIDLDINLDIGHLTHKKFSAADIKGKLTYNSGLLSFISFNLNTLDGYISGDCFIGQSKNKTFVTRGSFDLIRVDINKAFDTFNNFTQDFLKAENLSGTLSGKVSLILPLDSMLFPDFRTATADGKITISDGVLKNFEPVKSLSRFIELSELENITFSRFENDFYIKNNYIAFPQMDIKSSAADFAISGKHDFDNKYEYHVKTYLSQILSKKVKKKPRTTEFGSVEDDGLGRTSIFLKITGQDDKVKVGYDMRASRNNTNKSLKAEKDNMKNILNKEYGWYKKDSTAREETAPKPKFRIQWEETDSTRVQVDTTTVNKESGIGNLFKRKRGGKS
jgi:hypothetical protein